VGLLDHLTPRRSDGDVAAQPAAAPVVDDPIFGTKALRKFLAALTAKTSPVLLDLGPVVGSNVNFFGEQLGCKIFVENIYADLDRFIREGKAEELPAALKGRFQQADGSVNGVLCWDLLDYLDKASAQALALELMRILAPDGALLGFFCTSHTPVVRYTKYIIVDDSNLKHRPYPAPRGRQAVLLNRDIIRLFGDLRVSDSFLLQNNIREILFRKPV
jgi:hypothetical protein